MNFIKTLLDTKPADDETVVTLSKVSLFDNLSVYDLEELSLGVTEICFDEHKTIFKENQESDGMYIIKEGGVNVLKKDANDEEHIIVTLGNLDYFGEMSLIHTNLKRTATIKTVIPTTVYFLSKQSFNRMLKVNKTTTIKILYNLAKTLSERLRLTTNKLIGDKD